MENEEKRTNGRQGECTPRAIARRVIKECKAAHITVACAESCTGGLIAKLLTDIPGSSAVFCGGCVTYTNEAKMELLGVPKEIIERDSEVSFACAEAMARGVRERLHTAAAVSTTGFAGPGGGTEKDPVGTVYIAVSTEKGTFSQRLSFPKTMTRSQIRNAAAAHALALLLA